MVTTYVRAVHAAHYFGGRGHDLDVWTVPAPTMLAAREIAIAEGMPLSAEYHSGFLADGVQHWRFVRVAPMSLGTCDRCARKDAWKEQSR